MPIAGSSDKTRPPGMEAHGLHEVSELCHECQIVLSTLRTNTSSAPLALRVTTGRPMAPPETAGPWILSQPSKLPFASLLPYRISPELLRANSASVLSM